MKKVILRLTDAIGDAVIASALHPALLKKEYQTGIISDEENLPLWDGLSHSSAHSLNTPVTSAVVDISDYLRHEPHRKQLPKIFGGGNGHHCKWMAYELYLESGIKSSPSRDDIMVKLTNDEISKGTDLLYELSKKPVVAICPNSSTKNRVMPDGILEAVVCGIKDFASPLIMFPSETFRPFSHGESFIKYGSRRKAAYIASSADAIVCVDSGIYHIVNGVLQGTDFKDSGVNPGKNKVILLAGSSNPEAVSYHGNRVLTGNGCDIAPCGYHGYTNVEGLFGNGVDRSRCMFPEYEKGIAPCMASIPADRIIFEIKDILGK